MTYDEISRYVCGTRGNERFPLQMKVAVSKPLLSEVIDTVEQIIRRKNLAPVNYNIETKCTPSGDTVFHPAPAEFTALLLKEIRNRGIEMRVIVQSFDIRTLQEMHRLAPEIKLAFLEGTGGEFSSKLSDLGFTPAIYSPDYRLVSDSLVRAAHAKGIRVIPWTVNDTTDMKRLIGMGVDGIITDYPADLIKMLN
jgi:glycerophosphoryl diester phosphodiesterase